MIQASDQPGWLDHIHSLVLSRLAVTGEWDRSSKGAMSALKSGPPEAPKVVHVYLFATLAHKLAGCFSDLPGGAGASLSKRSAGANGQHTWFKPAGQ